MSKRLGGWSVLLVLVLLAIQQAQGWSTLWPQFSPPLGSHPSCELIQVGDSFYGMTMAGGTSNAGAFYRVKVNGTLANGYPPNQASPYLSYYVGRLQYQNSNFYGLAQNGGLSNWGGLFMLPSDFSTQIVLHAFTGGLSNGASPSGVMAMSGSMLYGTTMEGGISNKGVAFSYNLGPVRLGASAFNILHHFIGGTNDGAQPYSGLTLMGTNLYGTTAHGGTNDHGTLYKINLNGTGYTNLWTFKGGNTDGDLPIGELLATNNMLYGTTFNGGSANYGVVFSYYTGIGVLGMQRYSVLHIFGGPPNDGGLPYGGVTLAGTNLYGMAEFGGISNCGTIYNLHVDGTGYTNLLSFKGFGTGITTGKNPTYTPLVIGGYLYGTTYDSSNGMGVIFRLNLTNNPQLFFQANNGQLAAWSLSTTGSFLYSSIMENTGGWSLKAAGDVDGDGVADLIFQDPTHNTGGWFMNQDGTHRAASFWWPTTEWEVKACADYDGLGLQNGVMSRAQVIFQRPSGTVARWLLNPDGTFSNSVILGEGGSWILRGACDLDGDGKADLIFQKPTGDLAVWTHNMDDTIHVNLLTGTGEWALSGTVDVDGDRIPDLIWQTPDSRTGGWFMNANLTARSASFWWPTGGWKLKAAGR